MTRDFDTLSALQMVQDITAEAGRIALGMFGQVEGHEKDDGTLVTEADRRVEQYIRKRILDQYPHHMVFGEEDGSGGTEQSPFLWLLDPIDGTNNFASGVPIWGISVGLFYRGKPFLGVLHMPCLDQTFWASDGEGAYCDGTRVSVRRTDALARNDLLLISSPNIPHWDFSTRVKYRITGSTAYSMALVAAGNAVGTVCNHWYVWDVGASMVLLKEVGALVTDIHGQSLFDLENRDYRAPGPCMVAASPECHALLMQHVKTS